MADKTRHGQRVQATLKLLAAQRVPITRGNVWGLIKKEFPLIDDELEPQTGGRLRGETNWAWASTDLARAGWIVKGREGWEITDEGQDALDNLTDPVELVTESRRLYTQWKVGQDKQYERALSEHLLPIDEGEAKVIEGARIYLDRALMRGESVFASGRQIWTDTVAAELETNFVDAEPISGMNFMEQVAIQLVDASDDAKLLMAELVALQLLPISTDAIGEQAKRARVNGVLQLMKHPVLISAEIDSVFAFGAFNPGTRMLTNLGAAMTVLVNFAAAWAGTPESAKEELLDDPWRFREWVLMVRGERFPSQRHSLEYLIHPGTFISIVSDTHKQLIRDAFIGEISTGTSDLDRDLFAITIALQVKHRGPVNYYNSELRQIWQKDPAAKDDGDDSETNKIVDHDPGEDALVTSTERAPFAAADEALAAELLTDASWLQSVLDLLWRQRQVILYGPPGTGKTFLARALAKHISSGADPTIVQFHPSYSYEDFVDGYRPVTNEQGLLSYDLVPGPLLEIATIAAKNPELNYVLVIDEINRGNIAKVFGELYYLLEYRDEEIKLLYRPKRFSLPANVYFIGTMNTADRSIALLDAAMRRRFAFIELHPDEKPTSELLARWLDARGLDGRVAQLLVALNSTIGHRDARIGPSYFMPKDQDLSEPRLREIWRYQLLPLLEETHYGDGLDVKARFGLDAISRKVDAISGVSSLSDSSEALDAPEHL